MTRASDPQSVEPRQTQVTARLAAQGAMLEELRAVVGGIAPETARTDARRLIVNDNILQRPTLNSRTKLFTKLAQRYFPADMPQASARLVRAFQTEGDPQITSLIAYAMLLWNDALVFFLGVRWLAPRLAGAPYAAVTADVERELEHLGDEDKIVGAWSDTTHSRIAQHYLSLIRDVGFADGAAEKRLRKPYVAPRVVHYCSELIFGGGESAAEVPEHPLFAAMGLGVEDVIEALHDLDRSGSIKFSVQGGLVWLELKGVTEA